MTCNDAGNSHLQMGIEECKQQLFQDKNDKDAKKAIYVLTWLDDPIGDGDTRVIHKTIHETTLPTLTL